MNNQFILVRHSYDDHSYIDGKNDTRLTKKGIAIAKEAAVKLETEVESNDIIIRHSAKKRAYETAEIFCDYLIKKGFNCRCVCDYSLTELYQGKFAFGNMLLNERIDFLQSCWDDFEESRHNGDYFHEFGEKKNRSVILECGENHAEWSQRIAQGLLNIILDIENSYQTINISHRGAIYELEQLVKFCNGIIEIDDIEKYQTRWMKYCQDYKLELKDLEKSKVLIKKYKALRSKNENNN